MKLLLQCDKCGAQGDADFISTDWDNRDLCQPCRNKEELDNKQTTLKNLNEWLVPRLAERDQLEAEIKALTARIKP